YAREKGLWNLQAELLPDDGAPKSSSFAWPDVALHDERVFVSALGLLQDPGAAYVFGRDGKSWKQEAKLVAPDGDVSFGFRFYIHDQTAFIGAPGSTWNGVLSDGAVYVYQHRKGDWIFQQKLTSPDGAHANYFGYGVAGREDGDSLLVSAPLDLAPDAPTP